MLKVLEFSWMLIACLGACLGALKWFTDSFAAAIWFFLFTAVALIFWIVRRKQRISMEKRS